MNTDALKEVGLALLDQIKEQSLEAVKEELSALKDATPEIRERLARAVAELAKTELELALILFQERFSGTPRANSDGLARRDMAKAVIKGDLANLSAVTMIQIESFTARISRIIGIAASEAIKGAIPGLNLFDMISGAFKKD